MAENAKEHDCTAAFALIGPLAWILDTQHKSPPAGRAEDWLRLVGFVVSGHFWIFLVVRCYFEDEQLHILWLGSLSMRTSGTHASICSFVGGSTPPVPKLFRCRVGADFHPFGQVASGNLHSIAHAQSIRAGLLPTNPQVEKRAEGDDDQNLKQPWHTVALAEKNTTLPTLEFGKAKFAPWKLKHFNNLSWFSLTNTMCFWSAYHGWVFNSHVAIRPEIEMRMMVANKSLADAAAQYSSKESTQLNEVSMVPTKVCDRLHGRPRVKSVKLV